MPDMRQYRDQMDLTPIVWYADKPERVKTLARSSEEFFADLGLQSTTTTERQPDGRTKVVTAPLLS